MNALNDFLEIETEDGSPIRWWHTVSALLTMGCMGVFFLVGLTLVAVFWIALGRALF